jgi:DNA-binding transcriptional regulator YdaS (Cro superfamily)
LTACRIAFNVGVVTALQASDQRERRLSVLAAPHSWDRITMAMYVRVRKQSALRRAVEHAGTQTDVAERAGMSVQRLNQLITGVAPSIRVRQAAALEDTLGVVRGALFVVDSGGIDMIAPYLVGVEPGAA